jgi:ABC-type Na+ efflux pump permease subunit
MFAVQNVSTKEGLELVEAGEASGFLIIPEGFQDAFLNDTPVTLTLKTNPSQSILPGIIQDVTEIILDAGFYAQALFGPEIAQIKNANTLDQPADLFTANIAVQIKHKMEKLGPLVSPLVLDVVIVEPPPAEPRPDIALLFLPGIVMMALMFSASGLSSDYWKERETGTLRRLVSTPGLLNSFVLGKALAVAVVIAFIGGTTLVAGFLYHDVAWSKLPSSLAWIVVGGVGLFAWFAALQMMFSDQKGASLISNILLFPLLMMGGSFFPLAALPDWIASIGRLSPNGFVVDRLTTELTSANTWTFDANSWAIVFAMTFSGLAICSWRLRTGFARK